MESLVTYVNYYNNNHKTLPGIVTLDASGTWRVVNDLSKFPTLSDWDLLTHVLQYLIKKL